MLVASLSPRYPRTGYLLGHQGVERSSLSGHLATEQPPSAVGQLFFAHVQPFIGIKKGESHLRSSSRTGDSGIRSHTRGAGGDPESSIECGTMMAVEKKGPHPKF